MAKISTYPGPSSPSLSDMLIGTDLNDMLMTKNFTISDVLSLANLNQYVPYTGATGDVDLGVYKLTATSLEITTDNAIMVGIQCQPGANNYFVIGDNGFTMSGFLVDFVNNRYYLGDFGGSVNGTYLKVDDANSRIELSVNGTYLKVDDANSRIELSSAIYTNGSTGTSGQILTSQGAGSPATWITPAFVAPIYGSFYDTTTQTVTAGQVKAMELNTTDTAATNGFSITNNGLGRPTQITATVTGVYNLAFSAQLNRPSGGGGGSTQVDIWIRINGTDVPYSNTGITMQSNAQKVVAAWNFFVPLTAGQHVEIMWTQVDAVNILAEVAGINYPETPSVIATINRVS